MKFILFLSFVVSISAISDIEKFDEFKIKFRKNYSSEDEEAKRFIIFQDNLHVIETHNQRFLNGETLHKMGITRFADKTEEEYFDKKNQKPFNINKYNLNVSSDIPRLKEFCWGAVPTLISSPPNLADPPKSIDYRDKNLVMPPRDRGENNNDNVAFAIADNLEVCLAVHNGTKEYLSPQYIKDCAPSLQEGYYKAFLNGLPSEDDYPLIDGQGECRELCNGFCFGYSILAHEEIITNVVGLSAPVTIYFDGGDLALYESGIIDGSNCYFNPDEYYPNPDNWRKPYVAVVIGYGTENGVNYWIIKNSWGTSWGENGYFRLIKDKLACGIEAHPVAPRYEAPAGTCLN